MSDAFQELSEQLAFHETQMLKSSAYLKRMIERDAVISTQDDLKIAAQHATIALALRKILNL